MYYESVGVAVRTVVAVIGIVAVVQFILLPSAAAIFRQRMFALRRQLFVFMAEGNIRPDDPAYVCLRNSLNAWIRNAEKLTFLRICIIGALLEEPTRQYRANDRAHVDAISDEAVRKRLVSIREDMANVVIGHVITTSPIAVALLFFLIVAAFVVGGASLLRRANSGLVSAMRRIIMKKLRERIPTDSIGAEDELLSDRAIV